MKKLDIIFVKPGSQKQIYGELSDFNLTAIEPPLWSAILAAYMRAKGYRVEIFDAEVENWSYLETAQNIAACRPSLVAMMVSGSNPSASTMNMTGAGQIIRFLKELNPAIKTVFAGLHPSALPQKTLVEEHADFVCQGEGFYTLPMLVDALAASAEDFAIQGLWYKKNGHVVSNPAAPLMRELDELPMPAWDLLPMSRYRAHNWHCFDHISERQPYAILYTSLGCPFKCSFCCINALFGKHIIRYRSLDAVMDEIDWLVNHCGVRNIKIIDEMFGLNEKRVIDFCDRIIDRGYDLNMWAYARVNTVTEKMLTKMKSAGINWVAYGFESGSKRVIADVTKGYDMDLVEKVVQATYNSGLYICANFIFGLPEDDYDSMNETLKLMLDINAEWANIYSAMAYPGSQLYEAAMANQWQLPQSWCGFSQYSKDCLPLPTKYLTAGQVLAYRDYSFNSYYSNPAYLNMIQKKFGEPTLRHIQEMAGKRLPRTYAEI